jgi:two-component system CheB/CheR fusion protein
MPGQLSELHAILQQKTVEEGDDSNEMPEEEYKEVLSILHSRKGVDFTHYKQTTIRRRIARRVALSLNKSKGAYLDFLKANKSEQDLLYQDLLIPVTQFFRDPKIFESVSETVFAALLKDRPVTEALRIWIAGCSTGEEAYSFAIALYEYLGSKTQTYEIQVFATDISEIAITKARSGIYKNDEVKGLSASRLQKFFSKKDCTYQLNKLIRSTCIFADHNFLKDPPFANIDIISCRNSLIYFEPFLQKKALTIFHYALKEKGFLILGKSETVGQATDLFTAFDKHNRIYTKKAAHGRLLNVTPTRRPEGVFKGRNYGFSVNENSKDDFQKNADEILLAKYAPPGVIINNEFDIVQFRGATGTWLEASSGKPTLNVLKMIREGLAFELRNALTKVKHSKEAIVKENISIQFMGVERLVTLEVIPLLNTVELHFLILFRDTSLPPGNEQGKEIDHKAVPGSKQSKERIRIIELQKELVATRDTMRGITEEQDAYNQELQSTNEELISGSEELQSLNEELETSKEEIQTSNEELIVVNQELFDRNEQLSLSRLFAESIVSTIREPLIILNKDLQVRSANRAFYDKFQTSAEGTEGKLLFDLGNKQWDIPGLKKMLKKILPQKSKIVDFEVSHNFPALGERIMLLNATQILKDNSGSQSILLAIEDITEKRKIDTALKVIADKLEIQVEERTYSLNAANVDLRHSNENLEQFAYIASHDLQEPLRKIRTFSSLLLDRHIIDLPDGAKDLITKINLSSDRMSTLIKELLNFSKIVHGDAPFEKTDLNAIINEILSDFDLLIEEKKAFVSCEKLPVIEAIPLQIRQLFYNLIGNALKFSKKDIIPVIAITVRILTLSELQKHKDVDYNLPYCEISFKDTGIGFKQEYADRIFLIFHRLHGREHFPGTGIGLALCKKIVLNHHGEIYATSDETDGALFQIILPLTQHV